MFIIFHNKGFMYGCADMCAYWCPSYDVTIQRYRKSHTKIKFSKMHIFRCIGLKIVCEISKAPFEISHKILNPYTEKYAFHTVFK